MAQASLPTRLFLFIFLIFPILPVSGQNCQVDFPGTSTLTFSGGCGGPSVGNLDLGNSINLSDGDTFTFDLPVVNIFGNLHVDVDGNGKIIIPAGVTVNVGGDVHFHNKNSECTSSNPCVFEIVVNGTANFYNNFDSELFTLIWSGTGTVRVDDNFINTNNGCMNCGPGGCPYIVVDPWDCDDNGTGCSGGNFCAQVNNPCSSDAILPVIVGCPSNRVVNMTGPGCTQIVNWVPPTATDNCNLSSFTSSHTPGTAFPKGVTTVTYTAQDALGNTATCSFTVDVVDNLAPVISGCPANINFNANAACEAVVNWTAPTFTDNCAGATITTNKAPGSTFSKGITTVVYTARDAAGNTTTCSFNVNVIDNTAPVITGCPSDITVSANAACQATVNWTAPTFTDNCAGGTITPNKAPGSTFSKGITTVVYTARDVAGNTATCSFNVTVVDTAPPVITGCPANITVNANGSCQAVVSWTAPTFTDNCSGATLTATKGPGSTFAKGITTVIYTARDVAGNTSTCSFNVNVIDNIPPAMTGCPANITVNANAACQAVVNWVAPTFTDNCSGGTLTTTKGPGSTFPKGITTVVYTATDGAGNTTNCSFNVNVIDNVAPAIVGCPSNITVNADASCQAIVNWATPTFTDNCSGGTFTSTKQPGSSFNLGSTTVSYTATDGVGNIATCSFKVIVQDKSGPVFENCITDIVVNANSTCSAIATWSLPQVTDNCGTSTITGSHKPGDVFPIGKTEVRYTATDSYGNVSICAFNVIVKNEILPAISNCPTDIFLKGNEANVATADWIIPTASVPCGNVTMTGSHQPGDFKVGTTKIEYKATDDAGNTSSCYFNVIVAEMEIEIDVGKVVTPDGNGVNDEWTLTNIEKFGDNKVVIVDRWGGVVFSRSGYNNENIVWRGTNGSGGPVPTGTYFYTISVRFGEQRVEKSGFIEVIR